VGGSRLAGNAASSTPSRPSSEACDDPADGIDDRGNAGIGGANDRQAFFDGAQPRALLQMLIGAGAEMPNQPSLVRLTIQPGRSSRDARSRRERSPRSRSAAARAARSAD
jgi:hypothetical protein